MKNEKKNENDIYWYLVTQFTIVKKQRDIATLNLNQRLLEPLATRLPISQTIPVDIIFYIIFILTAASQARCLFYQTNSLQSKEYIVW